MNESDPTRFIKVLQENMLATDIAFSVQHPDEKIRNKAKEKTLESIDKLKAAGIESAIIFSLLCTTTMTLHVAGVLSLLNHRDLIQDYLNRIYDGSGVSTVNLMRQMIVLISSVKARASPHSIIAVDQAREALQDMVMLTPQ